MKRSVECSRVLHFLKGSKTIGQIIGDGGVEYTVKKHPIREDRIPINGNEQQKGKKSKGESGSVFIHVQL